MADPQIDFGRRIKFLREARDLTQAAVSKTVGFKDRQTLSDIEAGKRKIAPDEFVRIAKALKIKVVELMDPFRLVGEGDFNFRADDASKEEIDSFEEAAGRWIATYREMRRQAGVSPVRLGKKLELTRDSSFEEAEASADFIRDRWNLGDVPAEALQQAIERELGALVLYVDAPARISGAALHLPGLQTILVNRNEAASRRAFDLAHELFHLLTWDAMKPDRVEPVEISRTKGNRVEQLANKFAAVLLIPGESLKRKWELRGEGGLDPWLVSTASEYRVSPDALQWRLVNLGLLAKDRVKKMKPSRNHHGSKPGLFSAEFVTRIYDSVESGRLSMRRAAELLGLSLSGFAEVCRSYGRQLSYDA
jgi:Zn-dependent peptidase ImmA (M78 family)/DNA-binding XRE family transcriptional regulator